MKYCYLLFCLLGIISDGLAQKSAAPKPALEPRQPLRTELMLDASNSDVQVQPLPEDSSVVLAGGA